MVYIITIFILIMIITMITIVILIMMITMITIINLIIMTLMVKVIKMSQLEGAKELLLPPSIKVWSV